MRTIASLIALLAFGVAATACGDGEFDAECDDNAYETCTEDYNACAGGEGQCYQAGGVDQACLDACFTDYCLCLDDYNCDLEGSNCERAL
jgi:hypothetical protein